MYICIIFMCEHTFMYYYLKQNRLPNDTAIMDKINYRY